MPSDPRKTFRTHKNYLRAFDTSIGAYYLPTTHPPFREGHDILVALAEAMRASPSFARLKERDTSEIAPLRGILRNAWGTEFLLVSASHLPDDELMGIANNWAVVQAYYACYHAAQALQVARGQQRPESHPRTLQLYSQYWAERPVDLPPWSLGFQSKECRNLPIGRTIRPIHQWKGCDDDTCWSLIAMVLRTTRRDLLKAKYRDARRRKRSERRKQWEANEQERGAKGLHAGKQPAWWAAMPTLSAEEKQRIDEGLYQTTLLDYLCRLRLRSNYRDPTMFTDGPESHDQSRSVHQYLCGITSATLLVHELHVGQLIGQHRLADLVDEWLSVPAVESQGLGLAARQDILLHS